MSSNPWQEFIDTENILIRISRPLDGSGIVATILPCENQAYFAGFLESLLGNSDIGIIKIKGYENVLLHWSHQNIPEKLMPLVLKTEQAFGRPPTFDVKGWLKEQQP